MPRFSKYPPGVIIISPGVLFFGFVVIAVVVGFVWMHQSTQRYMMPLQQQQQPPQQQSPQMQQQASVVVERGDDRYTRAPKPEKDWMSRPDLSELANSPTALPSFATRGIPETYQSMGIISVGDGKVLPLYGRRTASRSDRFQYYTRTDTYNPVQLPVRHKNKPCEDVNGCEELFDGDSIKLSPNGESGTVKIYRFSGPTYIPLIG